MHGEQLEIEKQKSKKVRYSYGFEPCYLLLHFGFYLAMAIVQNQMLKQECLISKYNSTLCSDLSASNFTQEIEREIQPKVLIVKSAIVMLNSFFPPIYTLFLGSWSDIYGRKTIMFMSFFGYTTTIGLFAMFAYISDYYMPLTPWVYFIAEIPMTFLGGWPLLDVAACCYVTDISEKSQHSIRLGAIGLINFTMNFIGNMSSSFIHDMTNAPIVFIIAFCSCMGGLILMILIVDESISTPEDNRIITRVRNMISRKNFKEILQTLFKSREKRHRKILWCSLGIAVFTVFTMHGNGTVGYLFGREQFKWGLREFTVYDATNTAITAFGILACLTLMKKFLQISDVNLGLIAISSAIIEAVCKAFASETYQMYLASCIGVFRVFTVSVYLSILSNIFEKQEIGKIFSSAIALEAFSGMAAGPLYSSVYNSTIDLLPGAFHLITASAFFAALVLALLIHWWLRDVEIYHVSEQKRINKETEDV